MTIARDKANSTVTNFASTGIDDNADANAITIDSSENVGIGTSSATRKLDVHSGSAAVPINIRTTQALSLITFDNSSDTSGNHLVGFQGDDFVVGDTNISLRLLSAGGLCFGSDTAADNALDDYEQGTWTASYTGGGTLSGGNQTCRYTKIGNLVQVSGSIYYTSVSGGSGDLKITGFPFTQSSGITNYTTASIAVANWSSQAPEQANLVNTQLALLYGGGTSANSPIQTSSLVAFAEIYFSISYATDS